MIVLRRISVLTGAALCLFASAASASAPPVGKLPKASLTTVSIPRGGLVSVALPSRARGFVWRLARPFDGKVLHEVGEADVGANVVVVFAAGLPGSTKLVYALTKGETPKAYKAIEYKVLVR
jgi:hypothetical protein